MGGKGRRGLLARGLAGGVLNRVFQVMAVETVPAWLLVWLCQASPSSRQMSRSRPMRNRPVLTCFYPSAAQRAACADG